MQKEPIKVLYVLGFARSGTTLLGNILGEVPGFFHAGELHWIWKQIVNRPGARCGCGTPVLQCEFWSPVLSKAAESYAATASSSHRALSAAANGAGAPRFDPRAVLALQQASLSSLSLWSTLRGQRQLPAAAQAYASVAEQIYAVLSETTGARIIVDSSKAPPYGALLMRTPGIIPYYVHIVRDPRGAFSSRQRRQATKQKNGQVRLNRVTLTADSLRWMRNNLHAELLQRQSGAARSLFVSYEDFVAEPVATIRTIVHLVGEQPDELPFRDDRVVYLKPNHGPNGNRNRFLTGEVRLRPDTAWMRRVGSLDRALITALTSPFLMRYHYPFSPRPPEPAVP